MRKYLLLAAVAVGCLAGADVRAAEGLGETDMNVSATIATAASIRKIQDVRFGMIALDLSQEVVETTVNSPLNPGVTNKKCDAVAYLDELAGQSSVHGSSTGNFVEIGDDALVGEFSTGMFGNSSYGGSTDVSTKLLDYSSNLGVVTMTSSNGEGSVEFIPEVQAWGLTDSQNDSAPTYKVGGILCVNKAEGKNFSDLDGDWTGTLNLLAQY